MSETERAWAAGFFDGEGHIGGHSHGPNKKYIDLKIDVVQTTREELDRLHALFELGNVTGPYQPKAPRVQQQWRYRACGFQKCQQVMCILWPYLCTKKREQFKAALQKYKDYDRRRKEAI